MTSTLASESTLPVQVVYTLLATELFTSVAHASLATYGTWLYIRTPKRGREGRLVRILTAQALVVNYIGLTVTNSLEIFSPLAWKDNRRVEIAIQAFTFILSALYLLYQGYRCYLCSTNLPGRTLILTVLIALMIEQSVFGLLALVTSSQLWSNGWLLSFSISITCMTLFLIFIIARTRFSLWKALDSGHSCARALDYLKIIGESAAPVPTMGVLHVVSVLTLGVSDAELAWAAVSKTLFFALLSLWPQVVIFRRTLTLHRLHQPPTFPLNTNSMESRSYPLTIKMHRVKTDDDPS